MPIQQGMVAQVSMRTGSAPKGVSVRDVTADEAAALAGVTAAAFAAEPLIERLLPGNIARRFALPVLARLVFELAWLPHRQLDVALRDGQPVGFAVWAAPGCTESPLSSVLRRIPAGQVGLGTSLTKSVCAAMQLELARPTVPHWSLECLAVHPRIRREGIANALLANRLRAADTVGDAAHAYAWSPAGVGVLAGHGFTTVNQVCLASAPAIQSMYRAGTR